MTRIILAAIVGGIIVFAWSAIAHMATPLGTAGLSSLPNEDPVIDAMRNNIHASGLYVFPGFDASGRPSEAQMAKMRRGPTGLIAYTAGGMEGVSPRNLILELTTNILAALIAAIIVSMLAGTVLRRAIVVALLALFATLSLTASYWIWYGFSATYVLGELTTEIIGWFLAGLAMAAIIARAGRTPVPAPA